MTARPVIGMIGAGKVGMALARLLFGAGYSIAVVHSRTRTHAQALAERVNADAVTDPREVLAAADLTLLTVPDDVLESLAAGLAADDLAGKGVVHTSGAHDRNSLQALAARGAMTGSLHPAYPFADPESSLRELDGVTFAVEAEDALLVDWLGDIVTALNGTILSIPPGGKALYHAALVIASNYTVTLYAAAERLLLTLTNDRGAVDQALNALVGATVTNLRRQGIPQALTGPLVRGDAGTLAAHLDALEHYDPELAALYAWLGHLSLPLLTARGLPTEQLNDLLDRTSGHETDHTRYSEDESRPAADRHADGL